MNPLYVILSVFEALLPLTLAVWLGKRATGRPFEPSGSVTSPESSTRTIRLVQITRTSRNETDPDSPPERPGSAVKLSGK